MPPQLPTELEYSVLRLKKKLRCESFTSSYEVAEETAKLVCKIVKGLKWKKTNELIAYLKKLHAEINEEKLSEASVASNVLLRVMKIISTEDTSFVDQTSEQLMAGMMKKQETVSETGDKQSIGHLKDTFTECISEYIDELENSSCNIASQCLEHIHSSEIILTIGYSRTVGVFLQEAAKSRTFQVLIAEGAPLSKGHELAKVLVDSSITTTVLPDSNIFAVMSRVNKVIIGAKVILADGSLIAPAGTQLVAQAAHHFSVPVVCLGAFYKITPSYLSMQDQEKFNTLLSPEMVLPLESVSNINTRAVNPAYDFVPAEYITLLISSSSGHDPSYLSKLIFDLYPKLD